MTVVISGTDGVDTPAVEINGNTTYLLGAITYLTSGTAATYTTPTNARALYVECVGGGGGGGGVDGQGVGTGAAAGGGNGGSYTAKLITSPSASYTYTIGAGGTGGAAGANNGTAGGTTTFSDGGLTLTATGGALGAGHTAAATNTFYPPTSVNSASSGGDIVIHGGFGGPRLRGNFTAYPGGLGGSSFFGGPTFANSGANSAIAGQNATEYGAGGSGAAVEEVTTNEAGGDGYQGVIRITVYY